MEMKLPVGFRFRPTDEELMVHYLRRKARSLPLPASIIPELDVFHSDPWSLPGDLSEKRYYFWKKKLNSNRKIYYETSSGYWKCNNSSRRKGKQIVASISEQINYDNNHGNPVVIGTRKMWTFHRYRGRQTATSSAAARTSKTRWVFHEFHLREEVY
uniref:Putative NAC domain class transcription factor n=1 Tax=Tamarix hispida TaxID=189793 RepID=T2CBI3_9CARY|nr:putative NAC domain class transcription factor [Tamarix hispida]